MPSPGVLLPWPPSQLSSNVDPKCRLCPLIPVDGKRRPQTLAGSLSQESKCSFPWASPALSLEQDDNGGSEHGRYSFSCGCHNQIPQKGLNNTTLSSQFGSLEIGEQGVCRATFPQKVPGRELFQASESFQLQMVSWLVAA